MSTTIYLVSGTSFTQPSDWPGHADTVYCIGGGAAGLNANATPGVGISGGGGAFAQKNGPVTFATGQAYHIAPGGTTNGAAGGDTYLGASLAGSICGAQGAQAPPSSGGGTPAGGLASSSVGDVTFNGGNGGTPNATYTDSPPGAGAAGGPNGAGAAGASSGSGGTNRGGLGGGGANNGSPGQAAGTNGIQDGTAGGNNRSSTGGGAFGVSGTPAGGNGTSGGGGGGGWDDNSVGAGNGAGGNGSTDPVWDATHGPGSGAGAVGLSIASGSTPAPGNGGLYGGGGAGGGKGGFLGFGTGAQGIIVIIYTPTGGAPASYAIENDNYF